MRNESGRSLIEVIGVMAIAAVMGAATIGTYTMIRSNQARTIAAADLDQIAQNIKLLMEMRGTYEGLSIEYLIKAGALKSDVAPIGGAGWSITPSVDGTSYSINLVDLSEGECDYFEIHSPKWASYVTTNGFRFDGTSQCFDGDINQISFVVE